MKFENMNRGQKMQILEPAIIEQLRRLGGKSSRKKLRMELRENVKEFPETAFDEQRIGKNGNTYCPLDIIIQFTLKNLEIAGFIIFPERGQLALTELGISVDPHHMWTDEIGQKVGDYWNSHRGKRRKGNSENEECDDAEEPLSQDEKILEEIKQDEDITENWENELKKRLLDMSPVKFELFCRNMVSAMGLELDEELGVSSVRDGGIDGYGYHTADNYRKSRVAIQAKRWSGTVVGSPEIDKFRGAIDKFNAEYGIFITTSTFSRDAMKAALQGSKVITLIDGDEIIEIVKKYKFCLKTKVEVVLDL